MVEATGVGPESLTFTPDTDRDLEWGRSPWIGWGGEVKSATSEGKAAAQEAPGQAPVRGGQGDYGGEGGGGEALRLRHCTLCGLDLAEEANYPRTPAP